MGLLDSLKRMLPDNDSDDYDETYADDAQLEEELFDSRETPSARRPAVRENNVVSINTKTNLQVVVVQPEYFDDITDLADHLVDRRTLILNLERTDRANMRRILDFTSGVVYSLGGSIRQVAHTTYLVTPCNINIIGNLTDLL